MGNTFCHLAGGVDAVEREFGDGIQRLRFVAQLLDGERISDAMNSNSTHEIIVPSVIGGSFWSFEVSSHIIGAIRATIATS